MRRLAINLIPFGIAAIIIIIVAAVLGVDEGTDYPAGIIAEVPQTTTTWPPIVVTPLPESQTNSTIQPQGLSQTVTIEILPPQGATNEEDYPYDYCDYEYVDDPERCER